MIIDTHLHVIDQSALRYPWLSGVPALNRDFSYEEYAQRGQARRHRGGAAHGGRRRRGRHRGRDRLCRQASREQPGNLIVGAIAACRPEDQGFAAYLERQQIQPVGQGIPPRAARRAGRAFGRRAVSRKHQAACRHRPDLRPLSCCRTRSRGRSSWSTSRPTCSSCSTIAACPTSSGKPSTPGAST